MTKKKNDNSTGNWRFKIPVIVGGGFLAVVVAIALFVFALDSKKDRTGELFKQASTSIVSNSKCHFTQTATNKVIDFKNDGLISDRRNDGRTDHRSYRVNIKAGKYKVSLDSFDGHRGDTQRSKQRAGQEHEQYRVEFLHNGKVVAVSGYSDDLKDKVDYAQKVTVVNNQLTIPEDVDTVITRHKIPYKAPDYSQGPHSLQTACMELKSIDNKKCATSATQTDVNKYFLTSFILKPTDNQTIVDGGKIKLKGTTNGKESDIVGWRWIDTKPGTKSYKGERCHWEDSVSDRDHAYIFSSADKKKGVEHEITIPRLGHTEHHLCLNVVYKDNVWTTPQCAENVVVKVKASDGSISIDKSVSKSTVNKGEAVIYKYKVTNTSKVELHDIKVSDDKLGKISCPKTTLAPGKSMDCSDKKYSVGKSVTNIATVTAKDTKGKVVSSDDSVSVSVNKKGEKKKKSDDEDDCDASIGNYIWYDTNGNGVQDDIEEGIDGIKVCAFNGNKKYCDTTNKNGKYKIDDLCDGTYDVVVKGVDGKIQTYDPDGKKDNKTKVKLKEGHKYTKADFGYRGSAPKTGVGTNIALILGFSTILTIGALVVMRRKGSL
jgi:LPXTG-motif cell wall-anchored protein